jgi:hypothetical protein
MSGDLNFGSHKGINLQGPSVATDAANKGYVDAAIAAIQSNVASLGNVFNYVATVNGGVDAAGAFDLAGLDAAAKQPGDYYKVAQSGFFKVGTGTAFKANVGDGLVFNPSNGVDVIDNTDSNISGVNDINVTGSADVGFVVDTTPGFKSRISAIEASVTSEASTRASAVTAVSDKVGNLSTLSTPNHVVDKTTVTTAIQSALDFTEIRSLNLLGLLNQEHVDRAAGDNAIKAHLGEISALTTTVKTDAVSAINSLKSALDTATQSLGTQVTNLVTNVTTAGTDNTTALDAEIARAKRVEGNLPDLENVGLVARSLVSAIAQTYQYANQIQNDAFSNTSDTIAEFKEMNFDPLKTAYDQSMLDLQWWKQAILSSYAAYRYTYESTTAVATHTIAHNLQAKFLSVTVMVERADGSWRNDVVSVEHVNDTTLKVYLSAAANIRITVVNEAGALLDNVG